MTRSLVFLAFSALAMAQSAAVGPAPGSAPVTPAPTMAAPDWRFAHPDADMRLGINMHAVMQSEAFQKGLEQAKANNKNAGPQVDMMLGMLRLVDRVSISARQKAPNDTDVLAEVTGSFDPNLIAAMFPSTGKSQVRVVADHTILIGDGSSFTDALARINGPARPSVGTELEQSDLWVEAGGSVLQQQTAQQNTLPMLKEIKKVALGLNLAASPEVNMVLTSSSDASAASMLATMQGMLPLLAASPQSAPLMKNLHLSQDGPDVRMHLVVPPELVEALQQQAVSAAGNIGPMLGGFGAAPKSSSPQAPPKAQPAPGAIRIYGLDGGPKEIPVQK